MDDCKKHGQFDVTTMGNVANVGLMARKVRKTPSLPRCQLQPFIAVFPQECMGQLASFGPT